MLCEMIEIQFAQVVYRGLNLRCSFYRIESLFSRITSWNRADMNIWVHKGLHTWIKFSVRCVLITWVVGLPCYFPRLNIQQQISIYLLDCHHWFRCDRNPKTDTRNTFSKECIKHCRTIEEVDGIGKFRLIWAAFRAYKSLNGKWKPKSLILNWWNRN